MAAPHVAVHDVVVQQGEAVDELDGDRGGRHARPRRESGGGQQAERRSQRLATRVRRRFTARVKPAQGSSVAGATGTPAAR
jgi:hypothetical protein